MSDAASKPTETPSTETTRTATERRDTSKASPAETVREKRSDADKPSERPTPRRARAARTDKKEARPSDADESVRRPSGADNTENRAAAFVDHHLHKPRTADSDDASLGWTAQTGVVKPSDDPQEVGMVVTPEQLPDPAAQREVNVDPIEWAANGTVYVDYGDGQATPLI